jgi:hypothetical protein
MIYFDDHNRLVCIVYQWNSDRRFHLSFDDIDSDDTNVAAVRKIFVRSRNW